MTATDTVAVTGVFAVEAGRIADFARAVGATSHADAPPTFGVAISVELLDRLLDRLPWIDRTRLLHGEQQFSYLAPIRPGMRLRSTARLLSVERRSGRRGGAMRRIVIGVEHVEEVSGRPVLQETMVLIQTEAT